jgi:uncharacterized protein
MTIFEAVESGELEKVKARIAAGDDVNALGKDNITPLMVAAERGHDLIVEALLYAGAEPTLTDRIGETALMKASANAHTDVYRRLMPLASADEADQARALLQAVGMTHGPEKEIEERFAKLKSGVARAGAKASSLVGHENPQSRVDRINRADKNKK